MTTPLEFIIKDMIIQKGPMDLATYMRLCLTHPDHGYYTTRDAVIGRAGDFVTAPEISQLFGEMIGFWVADLWAQMGRPKRFILGELGPGHGTLISDVIRILSRIPGVLQTASIHLIEVSEVLIAHQARALAGIDVTWHETVDDLPDDAPLIIVNNEFFDALPVHQYVGSGDCWDEVVVGLDDQGELALGRSSVSLSPTLIPLLKEGEDRLVILEFSPDRDAVAATLFTRAAMQGGAVLTIDYGYDALMGSSTIQAVRGHQKVGMLDHPGESDLTALVDFSRLCDIAWAAGLSVAGPVGQGAFLKTLGVDARLRNIINTDETANRAELNAGLARLVDPGQMGTLFKVMCAYHTEVGVRPEGF